MWRRDTAPTHQKEVIVARRYIFKGTVKRDKIIRLALPYNM